MAAHREQLTTERTRVLRVVTRLNVGGPALHVAHLTRRLDPERYETLLVAGQEGPREGSMLELGRLGDGLRVVRVATLGREISPLDDIRALAEITRIARRFKPHIVHTHLAKAGFAGRIAARLAGARAAVHTFHGSIFRGYFGSAEARAYLTIERALARLSTRLIAITPRQRAELIALGLGDEHRIVEIPLGLDLTPFLEHVDKVEARRSLGLPQDLPLIGIVARLVPVKDIGTFLAACAMLFFRLPDARAVIVGDGDERGALEARTRELGIAQRCHFLGWVADVRAVYAALDVVVLTSLNEGSPVSVIEAMAAARPVVATSVGGVPDVVRDGETGRLVPARDPASVVEALAWVLDDRTRASALGAAGRRLAYPRYDVSRLVGDVDDLYRALLRPAP